ncbi:MAG: glutamine--fructose-6-phosphate transaminase (isomerizing) [Gammaproteobacteria bacterium]
MCGIVGAIAERQVTPILLEGLRRLEYRGYDSAGLAVTDNLSKIMRLRRVGKVAELEEAVRQQPLSGCVGIAHTRWATHGKPTECNAHPHMSGEDIAVVHNGIIENFQALRTELIAAGYAFTSDTDTEVIAHSVHAALMNHDSLLAAVETVVSRLKGAYALAVISEAFPDQMVVARKGSPLVLGVGIGEHYIASDQLAISTVCSRFIFLEEGDVASVSREALVIKNAQGQLVQREIVEMEASLDAIDKGSFKHYMHKEIHEQPLAIRNTLEGRIVDDTVSTSVLGPQAEVMLETVAAVQIVACGTSYHAGLTAKYWFEAIAGVPCHVEIASEFRYRKVALVPNTLLVTVSQSGETADTLAALRDAKADGNYLGSLAICNVPGSSLVRESDFSLMTRAGREIGVASTKAFTTQLTVLCLLMVMLAKQRGLSVEQEASIVKSLRRLPSVLESVLSLESKIEALAELFSDRHHALFLGRGAHAPIAMEGALKLKEISYIHAEAYPAGELKHGPLALVDAEMPVIAVAPKDDLLDKLKGNLHEVQARGGLLFVFADRAANLQSDEHWRVIEMPEVDQLLAPIVYTVPLQLLSYFVALIKGTDVDQPRNLAKSVTVE